MEKYEIRTSTTGYIGIKWDEGRMMIVDQHYEDIQPPLTVGPGFPFLYRFGAMARHLPWILMFLGVRKS